jgi:hypothetical protein
MDDAVHFIGRIGWWVVAFEVSKQPPWSMATSTSTEPGRISVDASAGSPASVPQHPESAPRRSPDRHRQDVVLDRIMVEKTASSRGRRSSSSIFQAIQRTVEDGHLRIQAHGHARGVDADHAAADHQDFAGFTPGTPPSSTPMPPCAFSSACAPAWIDMRPGHFRHRRQQGRPPLRSVTVS